jgi:hypothetical protein
MPLAPRSAASFSPEGVLLRRQRPPGAGYRAGDPYYAVAQGAPRSPQPQLPPSRTCPRKSCTRPLSAAQQGCIVVAGRGQRRPRRPALAGGSTAGSWVVGSGPPSGTRGPVLPTPGVLRATSKGRRSGVGPREHVPRGLLRRPFPVPSFSSPPSCVGRGRPHGRGGAAPRLERTTPDVGAHRQITREIAERPCAARDRPPPVTQQASSFPRQVDLAALARTRFRSGKPGTPVSEDP